MPNVQSDRRYRAMHAASQVKGLEHVWELFNPRSGANGGHRHGQSAAAAAAAAADGRDNSDAQIDDDYRQHVVRILQAL